jgi:sortase A
MKKRSSLPGLLFVSGGIVLLVFAGLQFSGALETKVQPLEQQSRSPTVQIASIRPSATPPVVLTPIPSTVPVSAETADTRAPAVPLPQGESTLAPIATLAPAPAVADVGRLARAVRIVIPKIHIDSPVVEMGWTIVQEGGESIAEWNVPDSQVGHSIGTANPGERGNVVLSGHNNLFAAVFRKLYTLAPGDEITLYNSSGQGFVYRVAQSYIVKEAGQSLAQRQANASVLLPTKDARVTLTSCWPETSNTHRAIVIAVLSGEVQQ